MKTIIPDSTQEMVALARIWDATSAAELPTLVGHLDPVSQAFQSADLSRILTVSSDGTARVWDTTSGTKMVTLSGHTDPVYQAVWNQDESRILIVSADWTVQQYYTQMEDLLNAA